MNATANNAADTLSSAGREAAAHLHRHSSEARGFASEELRAFLADVEDLLKKIANVSDAEVARLRTRLNGALGEVRRAAGDAADTLRDRARVAMDVTDDYVRERPWTAVGVAAAVGLLLGIGMAAASRRRGG